MQTFASIALLALVAPIFAVPFEQLEARKDHDDKTSSTTLVTVSTTRVSYIRPSETLYTSRVTVAPSATSHELPYHTTGSPQHASRYPHSSGEYPHHTGEYPHHTGEYPHHTGEYPHHTGEYPHHTGKYLHHTGEYSHHTRATEDNEHKHTRTGHPFPSGTGNAHHTHHTNDHTHTTSSFKVHPTGKSDNGHHTS